MENPTPLKRFDTRSDEPELMDDLRLDDSELKRALADIRLVNRLLGGHSVSLGALKPYMERPGEGPLKILDIGCGNGAFLRYVARYSRKASVPVELIGWDMNPTSLQMATRASESWPEVRFERRDILQNPPLPPDCVVVCNLFLHHFSTPQIRELLTRWVASKPKGIIINDLHRHPAAFYLFRLFGRIFMKSPVARHDGAISIQRGFRRSELKELSAALEGVDAHIAWKWAFRYLWRLEPI